MADRTPDREMTVQDWKALYLVWQLAEQVVLHGKGALDTFMDAAREIRPAPGPTADDAAQRKTVEQQFTEARARAARQQDVAKWTMATFGASTMRPTERAMRFMEEAIELVQAVGLEREAITKLIDHVYAKPVGQEHQELGGVGICVLALAWALGLDADYEERREWNRVKAIPVEHFRQRHNAKADAGISTYCDDPPEEKTNG